MNFLTKLRFLKFSYNFEKDYIKNIIRLIIGTIFMMLSLLGAALNLVLQVGTFVYYLCSFFALVGVFVILTGDNLFAKNRLFFKDIDPVKLKSINTSGAYGDYDLRIFQNQYFLYSPIINKMLSTTPIKTEVIQHKFALDDSVRKTAPFALKSFSKVTNKKLFKNQFRLVSDITLGGLMKKMTCQLQEADYFSGLCSNEMALKEIWSKDYNERVLNGMDLFVDKGLIINLQDSFCANIIEINSLLFTQDGKFVVQRQNNSYADNYNLLIPSVSKSLEYMNLDFSPEITLQQLLQNGIDRELQASFNLSPDEVETFILSHTRLLNRGGKPEFFAISKTTRNARELQNVEEIFTPFLNVTLFTRTPAELNGMIEYMFEQEGKNYSGQLYINMLSLADQLGENRALIKFMEL